jgi:UDP-GlcNAc:undecaprenyl-phosphate/decaprenyl-phosphate GlcNAc-1-phosphate transferase
MRLKWALLVAVGLSTVPARAEDQTTLQNERDRASYALGVAQGRSLKQQGAPKINLEMVIKGLKDAFSSEPLLMSEQEFRQTLHSYQQEMIRMTGKVRQLANYDNRVAGDAYRAENGKKEGVVTLDSGLQYRVITAGTGEKPTADDTVICHYRGSLINGTEFDSTYRRKEPASFELKRSITGWREALLLMPVGSKWEIVLPPELAYATQGAGEDIGPSSTLIFEIELIGIQK